MLIGRQGARYIDRLERKGGPTASRGKSNLRKINSIRCRFNLKKIEVTRWKYYMNRPNLEAFRMSSLSSKNPDIRIWIYISGFLDDKDTNQHSLPIIQESGYTYENSRIATKAAQLTNQHPGIWWAWIPDSIVCDHDRVGRVALYHQSIHPVKEQPWWMSVGVKSLKWQNISIMHSSFKYWGKERNPLLALHLKIWIALEHFRGDTSHLLQEQETIRHEFGT